MLDDQNRLKAELQAANASDFEKLAAALVGKLLGLPISVAGSGFQHGGDAGPGGRHGRRFRIECKCYADTSTLDRRELLGEIDQALKVDAALEAWILVTTRPVPEQHAQEITRHGEEQGIPVLILDWQDHEFSRLAALCAFAPALVEQLLSKKAAKYALALKPHADAAIASLRRDLQSWCLGFAALRDRSHEKLQDIWNSPATSNAELLQDAAGGARRNLLKRTKVHDGLDTWWAQQGKSRAPAAVFGLDGVGKTWATLHWLIDTIDQHPIVVVVPASVAAGITNASEVTAKQVLATRLYEMTGVRDREHWQRRLDRLLGRPSEEGPVLTVFFDGLNQEPSAPWLDLLKVLQGDRFAHRIRVIGSTRTHYFEERLRQLRGLIEPGVKVAVEGYSIEPKGELDQMLAFEKVPRSELPDDLIEHARRPRLFSLVMRLRKRPASSGRVTVHRLLWEYGRDTIGARAGSFSESDWQDWLKEIAEKYRNGMHKMTVRTLAETAARPDLSPSEVYARLSDIIDGHFAVKTGMNELQLTPTVVAHALGAALVWHISEIQSAAFETLEATLNQWLDPISGLDQRAEILRAAVSIAVESGLANANIEGVLVTSWLQTQNISETHRAEIMALGPNLIGGLLDAVEHSPGAARATARYWAIRSLRAISRDNAEARDRIIAHASQWLRIVSRDIDPRPDVAQEQKWRDDQLKLRIGVVESGRRSVMGVDVEVVDRADDDLQAMIPSLIEGYALALMQPVFEIAAVSLGVRGRSDCWEGLKWLCYLNEIDPDATADSLRRLSKEMLARTPEAGLHPELPKRIAGNLLRLTGRVSDENEAIPLETTFDRSLTYERDYLGNPARSMFALERRHVQEVLSDANQPLHRRIQRTKQFWVDPTFEAPESFVAEVRQAAALVDVNKLDRSRGHTIEDVHFEELEPILARCAPKELSDLIRRKLRASVSATGEARMTLAYAAVQNLILAGSSEAQAARVLREKQRDADETDESFAASRLLMFEAKDLGAFDQFEAVIRANLAFLMSDFIYLLRRPTLQEVDVLVDRYGQGSSREQESLLALLSVHPPELSDAAWQWVLGFVLNLKHERRPLAFCVLGRADPLRFGKELFASGWQWQREQDLWVNHYGSYAIIEATRAQPFDEIVDLLAPWCLLAAARKRGSDPAEVRLAISLLGRVLAADLVEEPDLGSDISVDRMQRTPQPMRYGVELRRTADEDPVKTFSEAFDVDSQVTNHRRAANVAQSRLDEARRAGASLLLVDMEVEDMGVAIDHAPDMVDRWLSGAREGTSDFQRRVRLAERPYLALCEALLARDPPRGADVCRALREAVATRFTGAAGVDDLIHMVFRAPNSQAVVALRNELLSVQRAKTDAALLAVAVAARYNDHEDWLQRAIEEDLASPFAWRQRRGVVLSGFTVDSVLPVEGAWPEGPSRTTYAQLERQAARRRALDACARHWWRTYWSASTPEAAYAAWVLFLRAADRRAAVWLQQDIAAGERDGLAELKVAHAELNWSQWQRFENKRLDQLPRKFLGRDIGESVGPWF